MGYDSRLYVVIKSGCKGYIEETKNKFFAEVVASVELCGCDSETEYTFRNSPATDSYIFVNGKECVKDAYGEPLKEIPLKEAINILQKGVVATNGYRRYTMALGLLQGMLLAGMDGDSFVVLHYGH